MQPYLIVKFLLYPVHCGPKHADTTVGDSSSKCCINGGLMYQTNSTVLGHVKKFQPCQKLELSSCLYSFTQGQGMRLKLLWSVWALYAAFRLV